MVAVWMVTYNQGEFIENAIESVMMQKCTFKYKLFIGEDNSTDKTREICKKLKEKYADKVELILHEKNIGSNSNGVFMYKHCFNSGAKYIALLEGDDYWSDPLKLQNQVDFLENNKDFSICFTDYKVYDESNRKFYYPDLKNKYKNKSVFSRNDIILSNFIPTATVMFKTRKEVLSKLDPSLYPGDWFLHVLNSEYGKIKFLPLESTVYRKHDGGVCSASKPIDNYMKYIKSIKLFLKVYDENYSVRLLFNLMIIKFHLQRFKLKIKG